MVQDTRELNRNTVLAHLLRHRPTTRKQLSDLTGISAATITRTVDQLIGAGLVVEVSELVSEQRGRRAVLLDIPTEHAVVFGVDLGASNTRLLTADLGGAIRARTSVPTPSGLDASALADWIEGEVRTLAGADAEHLAAGYIGLPGAVSSDGCSITNAPNLPQIEHSALIPELRDRLGCQVFGDNDANLALLGEQHFGAAAGVGTAVMLTIGAGLGAGIAVDGQILRGRHGIVGEFGQLPAGPLGTRLELMVTGPGLMHLAAESGLHIESPAEVFAADAAGQLRALRTHFDQALLIVLSAATVSCEPEVIVLGGGIADSLAADLARYEGLIAQHMGHSPRLAPSALGEYAGAHGAAVAALHTRYRELGLDEGQLAGLPAPQAPAQA